MFDELTKRDIADMQQEIEDRIKLRADYHDDIVMARSYGDLSENAEYHEAKRVKNRNESRIRYLRKMIKTAKIIEDNQTDENSVGYFDCVTILFEDTGEEDKITISTKMRIDATQGVISKESPLGNAIFGKHVGDRILVDVDKDVKYYVVIKNIEKGKGNVDVPLNKF